MEVGKAHPELSTWKIVAIVGALGMLFRFLFIWSGFAEGSTVADDAYYYFQIARNIGSGFGSTFDGLAPTNGYHPLWLLALVPVFKLFQGDLWTPVRAALSLCALFDLISGILLCRLMRLVANRWPVVVAALFWFLSPFTIYLGLRGLEASLSTLLILLLMTYLLRIGRSEPDSNYRSAILTGLLVGFAGLARTDNLVSVGLAVAVFALVIVRQRLDSLLRSSLWLAVSGVFAALTTLPWFAWNYAHFGSIVQVSGQTKFYSSKVFGALTTDWTSFNGILKSIFYPILAPVIFPARFLSGEEFVDPKLAFLVVIALVAVVAVPLVDRVRELKSRPLAENTLSLFLPAAVYTIVHTLLFGAIYRSYATWYALPFFACYALFLGYLLPDFLLRRLRSRPVRIVAVLLVAILLLGTHATYLIRLPQEPMRPARGWARDLTEITRRCDQPLIVGAFNAGAVGYVANSYPKITVTNLDCLVNNSAFAAVKEGRYLSYLTSTADLLIESPDFASMFLDDAALDSLERRYPQWPGFNIWGLDCH